jgi:hypothetical protein
MKFRNGIVDATMGSTIFDPEPNLELAIGSDPDCLTAGADYFCSGPSFLAPQQTYQSNHQLKYDGSRAIRSHILRYGGGWNHIFGGGFASFLALGPAVNAGISDCNATCLALPGGAANPLNYPANTVSLGNGQGYDSEIPAFGFPAGGSGPDNRISFYFGDTWKFRQNLTISIGLRYMRDTGRTDSDLGPIPALAQFNNQYYSNLQDRVNQPNHNFAPQLGVAWDPNGKGKTAIRGGIGLFFENSIWNNIEFDRPTRLPSGLFLADTTVCSAGNPVALSMPAGGTISPSFCGQPIGQAAPAIAALQAQYQASTVAAGPASNPSFIGNALTAGLDSTGTDLLAPNYVSPRSMQMNIGIQHEIRPGMVFTADYLRNIETRTLIAIDTNHVGDARFLNVPAARNAIAVTTASFGCTGGYSSAAINCAIANGATMPAFASPQFAPDGTPLTGGLDSGYSALGGFPAAFTCGGANGTCLTPATGAAFPGINPNIGDNQMLFPIGFAKNNALQLSLKQRLQHPLRGISNLDMQASYQLQRYIAAATDNDFINLATDFNNPQHYLGPNGLDRKNQISFGGTMDLPFHFRFGLIGHFYSPLPVTLTLNPTGQPGGIFVTDITGDGTGDGSFASNGGFGDVLPGTNIGSFSHEVNAKNINTYINSYNSTDAGQPTPAGQALINAGLFTLAQLQTPPNTATGYPGFLGVQQPQALAPTNEAGMGWLRAFDTSLNWIYKFRESFTIQPGVSFFNVFNFSNFDGPASPLSGVLSGAVGSINGTPGEQPASNRLGLGSGVFGLGSPRVIEFSMKVNF